jgi:hypothetical protein
MFKLPKFIKKTYLNEIFLRRNPKFVLGKIIDNTLIKKSNPNLQNIRIETATA